MKYFTVDKDTPHNEDSEPYINDKMLIVCDGLGGSGSNKHMVGSEVHTSAYYGARLCAIYTRQYFETHDIFSDPDHSVQAYKAFLQDKLKTFIREHGFKKTIIGRGLKLLPTTLAAAFYQVRENSIDVIVLWAGDSRVYCLSARQGLQQLTIDDIAGEFDALDAIGNTTMTNCISGDDDFTLHYARYQLPRSENLMLLAMSDGCFDYLPTPMDLEYVIENAISALLDHDEFEALSEMLESFYQDDIIKDDTTMAAVIFDETDVKTAKQQYAERYEMIDVTFRQPTKGAYEVLDHEQSYVNSHMIEVNKGMRDISHEITDYFSHVLSDTSRLETWPLRNRIMDLSCLSHLKDVEQENYAARVQLQQQIQQLNREFDALYLKFVDDYSHLYLDLHPDLKEKEEMTLNMQKPLGEQEHKEITDEDIIASLRAQDLMTQEIKDFLADQKQMHDERYALVVEDRDGLFHMRERIFELQAALSHTQKISKDHLPYLKAHRHEILRDVVFADDLIDLCEEPMKGKLRNYASIYREQEKHKDTIARTRDELEQLWRSRYKADYELYHHCVMRGDA